LSPNAAILASNATGAAVPGASFIESGESVRGFIARHRVAFGLTVLVVLGVGGTSAYGFYSASVATATPENATGTIGDTETLQTIELSAAVPPVKLGESDLVSFKARNPNTTQAVRVNSVTAGTLSVDSDHSACPAGSFTLTDFNFFGAQDIAPGATVEVGTQVLHYNNLAVSQNACIGAKLTVIFSTT
jgi:hypothetical protein